MGLAMSGTSLSRFCSSCLHERPSLTHGMLRGFLSFQLELYSDFALSVSMYFLSSKDTLEGLPRCDYRGGGSLASNPGPQANPLTEVVREVPYFLSDRQCIFVRHVPVHQQVNALAWLLCITHGFHFLPTRTARSTSIKEKDSDVVTDGTVGWRRTQIFCPLVMNMSTTVCAFRFSLTSAFRV